jgi:hypothetical protein
VCALLEFGDVPLVCAGDFNGHPSDALLSPTEEEVQGLRVQFSFPTEPTIYGSGSSIDGVCCVTPVHWEPATLGCEALLAGSPLE